jgi:CheY-like chemotaxis protein
MNSTAESARLPSVFVVDDEELVGIVVQEVLELRGYCARRFSDPTVALEAFESAEPKPRLLLTDFAMGPINGLELIAACKERNPGLKTILYSGTVEEEIFRNSAVRPDQFVSKPFLPKTLLEAIQATLAMGSR